MKSNPVEATVASIAESDPDEAKAYQAFIEMATPLVRAVLPAIRGEASITELPGRFLNMAHMLQHGPAEVASDLLSPYESLLKRWLSSDLTRGPVSAFAAHASVGPHTPSGAFFAFWQPITCSDNGMQKVGPVP